MNELAVADKGVDWRRLKAPGSRFRRLSDHEFCYNLDLDEFFAWYSQEPRPGFMKATHHTRQLDGRWCIVDLASTDGCSRYRSQRG
jgi:hypothetical protein